nr:YARHG domain-containing protein [Butyrivibrio sp.]
GYDMIEVLEIQAENEDGEEPEFEIVSKARDFLDEHCDFFMGTSKERNLCKDYVDTSILYEQIIKNDKKYGDSLLLLTDIRVGQINEWEFDSAGNYCTRLLLIDNEYNYYYVYYYGDIPYLEDDYVDAVVLPLDSHSFSNTDGGKTLCLYCAATIIDDPYCIDLYDTSTSSGNTSYNQSSYNNNTNYEYADSSYYSEYMLWDTDCYYYSKEDLQYFTDEELRIARNEILAKHGRTFKDAELQQYFDNQSWYTPLYTPEDFDKQMANLLNDYEKANIEVIKSIEAERK